ncbi:MAG: TonB-dependent receptor, partial [Acidobacteriota bacterium]
MIRPPHRGAPHRRRSLSPSAALWCCALVLASTAAPADDDAADADDVYETAEISETIVVTATRTERAIVDIPANVTVESMEQLERDGFSVGGDELRGEPGIFFRRGEGDNDEFLFVNVRGVIGNHGNDVFLALVDGMPFVGPDEEVLMNDIPYTAVEDVEIVRGPVSALYGRGGIAGAVSYSLRTPDGPRTGLRLAAGSDGYVSGRFDLSRAIGDQRVMFSIDGLSTDGWRENNSQDRINVFARGLFQVGDSTSISAWINHLDREYDTGSVIPTLDDGTLVEVAGGSEAFYGSRETGQDRRSLFAAGRLSNVLDANRSFEVAANLRDTDSTAVLDFYDFFGFDPVNQVMTVNGFDSDVETEARFLEAQATWSTESTTTLVGASVERVELTETDWWTGQFGFTFECDFAFFAIEIDYSTGAILNRDHPCFEDRLPRLIADSENTFLSVFAQTEWAVSDRVTLTLGGRWDDFERVTDLVTGTPLVEREQVDVDADHFSPKVALSVQLAPDHVLYANYGQGFSSNFGPVWQWDPSRFLRDTRPTTLDSVELGFKGRLGNRGSEYVVSFFDLEQTDRLVFVSNPDSFIDFTAPATIATSGQRYASRGVELSLVGRFGDSTRVRLDASRVEAEWEELVLDTFFGPLDLSGTE